MFRDANRTHQRLSLSTRVSRVLFMLAVLSLVPTLARAQGRPELVWQRGGHAMGINAVAYSPDGLTLATCSDDGTVKLFRVSDGMLLRTIRGFLQTARYVTWTPDGLTVVAAGADVNAQAIEIGLVKLFRASDGTLTRTITGFTKGVAQVVLSPDGQLLATAGYNGAEGKVFRVSDGTLIATLPSNFGSTAAMFSPDGQYLATNTGDYSRLILFRVSDWAQVRDFGFSTNSFAYSIAFSPDGSRIASANGAGVRVFSVADGSLLFSNTSFATISLAYSPDGAYLAAGETYNGSAQSGRNVRIWRTSDWSLLRQYQAHDTPDAVGVTFSPDSQALASVRYDIKLWRVSDGALLSSVSAHRGSVQAIAVSPDGQTIATGGYSGSAIDNSVSLWRTSDGARLRTFDTASNVLDVAFSPDNSILVTTSVDGVVKFWNVQTGAFIRSVFLGRLQVFSAVRFLPGGQEVAVLNDGSFSASDVVILRVSDGGTVRTLHVPSRGTSMALSADGRTIAVTGVDGDIYVQRPVVYFFVDAETTPSRTLTGPDLRGAVQYSTAFSFDESILVTVGVGLRPTADVGGGGSLWIWRMSDFALVKELPLPRQTRTVSFSADGASLIVGADDGLRIVRVSDWSLLQFFDQEVGPARDLYAEVSSTAAVPGTSRYVYGRADASFGLANLSSTPTCNVSVSPTRANLLASGGTGTIVVSAAASACSWSASTDAAWLTFTTATSGSGGATVAYAVAATTGAASRVAHVTIGGQTVAIAQSGLFCTYQLSSTATSVPAAGGTSTVGMTAPDGCMWSAISPADWVWISDLNQSAAAATIYETTSGNGRTQFTVFANPSPAVRTATLAIGGQLFTITQAAESPCSFALSQDAATISGSIGTASVSVTPSAPSCAWIAVSNATWVTITAGASGTGAGTVSYRFTANAGAVARTGVLTIAGRTYTITQPASATVAANGALDTPLDNATGINGSIAVSGWAVDDVGIATVRILRDPVAGETPGQLVFIGNATRVTGARPDVAGLYPTYPENTKAGWGYLMLTNMLPYQGNGTLKIYAYADDLDGHTTLLGSRTITCDNAHATAPFGAIDTPGQGETVSGTVINYGWVLGRGTRRADPSHGGTVRVLIDGVDIGTPNGWVARSDLTGLFPVAQYSGVGNALGVFGFDSTTLANGVHTIAWIVTDDHGASDGVGSRFFTVANGAGQTMGLAPGSLTPDFANLSADDDLLIDGVFARHGVTRGPLEPLPRLADGGYTLDVYELEPIELRIPGLRGGYLASGDDRLPLPAGSHVDAPRQTFTWLPGAGFIGAYTLIFDVTDGAPVVVRIVLHSRATPIRR